MAGEKLYTVILRDISARLAADREMRRFTSELVQLVEARTAELKEANAALEGYASAIAHITREEVTRQPIDLSALARAILAELATTEPERHVDPDIEDGLWAEGEPRMVEAMMRNLLGNAWKYTSRTPEARIRPHSEPDEKSLRYCITDNGAGFDMAYADQLFQPFRRLHSQTQFPGIGIGLATVQRIVRRHGGEITSRTEPGRGASFCFMLSSDSRK